MNYTLFFVLVAVILIYSLIIGKNSSVGIKNDTDYFLSGRSLGFFNIFMTILATQLGGGAIIGTAEAAYLHGWKSMSYSSGIALGLVFLALGIGSKFRRMNISTIPEIFQTVYKSENLRIFSSLLYIASMFLLLVAIGVSARKFAHSIGFSSELVFMVFWGVIIAYTTAGGLTAVTKTDILQILFVLIAFALTFLYLPKNIDFAYVEKIPDITTPSIPWFSWLIIPCLSNIIGQDMAQRCFAAKSTKIVPYAMISAAFVLIIATLLPTYLGILASSMDIEVSGSSVLIQVVSKLTNPYITSIFSAAILMAILSTADSILCALSSNISLDFDLFKKNKKDRNRNSSKLVTVTVGITAMLASFFSEDIIPLMIISYGITISALFVPIIAALIFKNPHQRSAYCACISGFVAFTYFLFFTNYDYKAIISILISLTAFCFAELFLKKK